MCPRPVDFCSARSFLWVSLNAPAKSFLWVGLNDSPCVSSFGTNVRSARRSRGDLAPRGAEGGGRADRSDWQGGVLTDPAGGGPWTMLFSGLPERPCPLLVAFCYARLPAGLKCTAWHTFCLCVGWGQAELSAQCPWFSAEPERITTIGTIVGLEPLRPTCRSTLCRGAQP